MGPNIEWGGEGCGVVGSQGIIRMGQIVLETLIWPSPVPTEGGLSKGATASASTCVWGKAAPPTLALEPDSSVPLRMSLVLFELLPQYWSSGQVSLSASESVHGPFKNKTFHSTAIYSGFHHQKLWGPLFLALKTWDGGQGQPPQLSGTCSFHISALPTKCQCDFLIREPLFR